MPKKQFDFSQLNAHPLVVTLGFIVTGVTLLTILLQAVHSLKAGRLADTIPLLATLGLGTWIIWKFTHVKAPDKTLLPNAFGSSPFSMEDRWEIPDLTLDVRTSIETSSAAAVAIVGRSGVGKSFLMAMVREQLSHRAWTVETIDRYDEFRDWLAKLQSFSPTRHVLVFDQFEQFLASASSHDRDVLSHQVRESLQNPQRRVVFVLRDDAFYRFVTSIDVPNRRFDIVGIRPESDTGRAIVSRLKNATQAPSEDVSRVLTTLLTNDEMLPLEVRIVGYHLAELQQERRTPIDWDYFTNERGGKDGIIKSYFNRRIDNLSDPETGMAVLVALALEGLYRRPSDAEHIAFVTHRNIRAVAASLNELQQVQLVREANNRYELTHDFIAEHARDATGLRLNPLDRDNIHYFALVRRDRDAAHKYSEPLGNTRAGLLPLTDPAFLILALVLVIRLLFPGLVHLLGLSGVDPILKVPTIAVYPPSSVLPTLDRSFLPVAICILAWMYFVSELYRRVLRLIHADPTSWFSTLLWSAASVGGMITAFIPSAFMALIFLAGILLGVKLCLLRKIHGLSDAASEYFTDTGLGILFFNLFGLAASIVTIRQFLKSDPGEYFLVFGWLAVVLTLISFTYAWNSYVARSAPNRLLSLVDRRRQSQGRKRSALRVVRSRSS